MISCIKKDFRIVSFAHLLKDHRCEFMEPETKHLFNAETFSKVKPGVVLINTSRGALVDSEALLSALRDGQVGAAGLDVYEEESEWFYEDRSEVTRQNRTLSPLVSMPNVIVTSHQAFLTREALANIATTTLANLDAYFMVSIFEPCMLYPVSSLQLSFSENGPLSSSEEKEKVAESRDMCYGKEIGFGSQPMKIAEASSRLFVRFFEIVDKMERCFRYHAFPQDRTAIKAG